MTPDKTPQSLKMKFDIFRFNERTKSSKLLGVVLASHSPDAIKKGWKKYHIPKDDYGLIYARRKVK